MISKRYKRKDNFGMPYAVPTITAYDKNNNYLEDLIGSKSKNDLIDKIRIWYDK